MPSIQIAVIESKADAAKPAPTPATRAMIRFIEGLGRYNGLTDDEAAVRDNQGKRLLPPEPTDSQVS